jgi:hypothetical protein
VLQRYGAGALRHFADPPPFRHRRR